MDTAQQIAERYVALWNEPEPARRREQIEAFFAPGAEHYVGNREAIGHDALEARIVGSHEKNVREGGNHFCAQPGARLLRNLLMFDWSMTPAGMPETVLAVGREVISLDDTGRAISDHMFIIA